MVLVFSFVFGVTMDIEFKGGAMVTVGYQGDVDLNNVKQTVAAELGQSNLTVQTGTDVSGAQTLTINLPGSETLSTEQLDSMIETLNTTYPDNQFVQQEVSNVNPTIGNEFLAKSVVAVVAACVLILVYVAVRFRRIGGWSAGAMAIVALLHDMFVVYGVFVLLRIPSTATLLQLCLPFWATPSTIPLLSMTVSARTPAFTAKDVPAGAGQPVHQPELWPFHDDQYHHLHCTGNRLRGVHHLQAGQHLHLCGAAAVWYGQRCLQHHVYCNPAVGQL